MILLASFHGASLPDDEGEDIQWMPPGVQTVSPHTAEGEVKEVTLLVDEDTAEAVEACRAQYQAEFEAGKGDAPFLDFAHLDQEAAAWVKRVYWGGDDPLQGGVRLVLDWTPEGRAKKGKSYKRFSPGFYASTDPDSNGYCHVTGAPANMGGLVNRAAFRTIQSLSASAPVSGGENQHQQTDTNNMTEDEIKALQEENAALKKQLEEMAAAVSEMQAKAAEETVEKACEEGRITPEMKAGWQDNILKNPGAKALLASMPVNPAFATAYKPEDNKGGGVPTGQALLARYAAITDPGERHAFFMANRKDLIQAHG